MPAVVAAIVGVLAIGWFIFSGMTKDNVVTGTKTGYGPGNMPPAPTFTIPPPPDGSGVSTPPAAGARPGP
ncbi:hypothetical protein EON82_19675 [bacterium]|nr:MAG: hypothetical protein EON82_19675 [bacterium]